MRSAAVVEVQVAADRSAGLADAAVGLEMNLLVFDAAPQPLDEDIVPPSAFAVHADRNAVVGERAGEDRATSMAGSCAAPLPPGPNTSAASPSSCAFHDVI